MGRVLHVHVAGLVALVGLSDCCRLLGLDAVVVARSVAAQTPVQPGVRDIGTEKFPHDRQQVIQVQQQGAVQVDRHGLLCGRRRSRLQAMRRVRAVAEDPRFFHLQTVCIGDAKALCQDTGRLMAGRDLSPHCRGWR